MWRKLDQREWFTSEVEVRWPSCNVQLFVYWIIFCFCSILFFILFSFVAFDFLIHLFCFCLSSVFVSFRFFFLFLFRWVSFFIQLAPLLHHMWALTSFWKENQIRQKRSITSFILVVCYLWLPDKQPFCDVIQLYFSSMFFSEVMYFNNRISHVLYREAHEMYTLFFIRNLTRSGSGNRLLRHPVVTLAWVLVKMHNRYHEIEEVGGVNRRFNFLILILGSEFAVTSLDFDK